MATSSRKQSDVTKLILGGYDVDLDTEGNSMRAFDVLLAGPKDTPFQGGLFKVHIQIPENYPYQSPSIGFEKGVVYHPNVDERSGSVCLDVINQTWTPLYSLVNIMDTFLPQLLAYPNPSDPLNASAAALYLQSQKLYEERVRTTMLTPIKRFNERQMGKAKCGKTENNKSNPINRNNNNSGQQPLKQSSPGAITLGGRSRTQKSEALLDGFPPSDGATSALGSSQMSLNNHSDLLTASTNASSPRSVSGASPMDHLSHSTSLQSDAAGSLSGEEYQRATSVCSGGSMVCRASNSPTRRSGGDDESMSLTEMGMMEIGMTGLDDNGSDDELDKEFE